MGRSRQRVRAAVRKAAERTLAVERSEAQEVAGGVLAVAQEIAPLVKPGSLYWTAPFQYVCEQMAPRVCAAHGLAGERREDVATYLLAGMNEYVVALVGEFNREHFEAWIAAADTQEVSRG